MEGHVINPTLTLIRPRCAELAVAAAAWPRSAEELDALLLDFGTWEFYVTDTNAMAAAAEAAAAEAPLPRMPPLAPLVVPLGRHLLGYATAAGWRRVAARLRADLSWMGLDEAAGVEVEVAAPAERPAAAAQKLGVAPAAASAPGPAETGAVLPCADVSPGADTEAGAQPPGEAAGAAAADSGSGSKPGPLWRLGPLRQGRKGAVAAADAACDADVVRGSGNDTATTDRNTGAGSSRDNWLSGGKCDGGRRGAAGAEVDVEDETRAFHRFADEVALQQGHM